MVSEPRIRTTTPHSIPLSLSLLPVQQAPIILLKEGTDTSQGKPQIISNINACEVVVDAVCSTLGPRGMDKLIVDGHGWLAGSPTYIDLVVE